MREPTFIAAVGMPGVGKTYQNIQQIRRVLLGNPAKGVKPQKVLIFDVNNEYHNRNPDVRAAGIRIKTIHPNQVARFSASKYIECCRIQPFNDNGHPMSLEEMSDTATKIMFYYRNGLLIAEDFKTFAADSMKSDFVSRLCTRRHSGADTLVSLQDIGMVQPKVWSNLKWLRLHKISDSVLRYKQKYPGKVEYLSIAENMINDKFYHGDERFYLMIDLVRGYIHGVYTPQEFEKAARQYISQNWASTVGLLLNERDDKWKKKYTEQSAAQAVLNRLILSFSQYSPRLKS